RCMKEAREDGKLIRKRFRYVAEEPQHVSGAVKWMCDQAACDDGSHWMKLKFEGSHHAEVPTPTSKRPEQLGLFLFAWLQELPIGGDEFDGAQIVESQAVLAHQPAHSTAEGEPSDSRGRHHTAGHRQAVQLRLAVKLGPCDATLSPCSTILGVDVNGFHS